MKKALTTLCYLEKNDAWLMMHRVKKENDVNKDKWIGVGGHAEDYESPEDCLLREVWEETGLRLTKYRFRGIVTFSLLGKETQYMCLYTATGWEGTLNPVCKEGILQWIPVEEVKNLDLWTGDRIFFELLKEERPFFSLKLFYDNDRLMECVLDGKKMEYLDIVDEKGEPTGIVKERSLVHAQGDLHRTSHLWLACRRKGQTFLLLQKRSAHKDSHPGCYDISSAGHILAGDSFLDSAVRELEEELGVRTTKEALIYCGTRRIYWKECFYGKDFIDNQVSNVYLFWHDQEEKDFILQKEEVESVRWMEIHALQDAVRTNSISHCIFEEELAMVCRAAGEVYE